MNQEKHTPQVLTKVFLDSEGKDAARLGEHGFTNKFIAQQTGLSEGQVQYRLTLAGIKRRSFRNGETAEAKRVAKLPMSSALSRKLDRLCKDIDDLIKHDRKSRSQVGKPLPFGITSAAYLKP